MTGKSPGTAVLVVLSACATAPTPAQSRDEAPLDVSQPASRPERFHDTEVHVRGIVASVCEEDGCFIDIVPLSGRGEGVLVGARHRAFEFPQDSVGKLAVVRGTFYDKVYPLSRMEHWRSGGWRAKEESVPQSARIHRIQADSVDFEEPETEPTIEEAPLAPHASPVIELEQTEFEAAGMGTGRKCMAPGRDTPEHSTRRYHELLLGIEGEVTVRAENAPGSVTISPGQAFYIPPHTRHSVANESDERACYVFVYAQPQAEDREHGQSTTEE